MTIDDPVPDDAIIESTVFQVLKEEWRPPVLDRVRERFLNAPRRELKKEDRLVGDVWGDGDDAGCFVLKVEQRLGITIPSDEWSKVYTIQDVIDLFKRYRNHTT